jgi:hypothetical protein
VAIHKAEAVWSNFRFHRGASNGRFEGLLTTSGEFVDLTNDGSGIRIDGRDTIRVSLNGQSSDVTLRFRTEPKTARLSVSFMLDGKTLGAHRFYVGAYGLKLIDEPLVIKHKEHHRLAASPRRGPATVAGVDAGVFFWQDNGSDDAPVEEIESAGQIESEIRELMKSWGYVK